MFTKKQISLKHFSQAFLSSISLKHFSQAFLSSALGLMVFVSSCNETPHKKPKNEKSNEVAYSQSAEESGVGEWDSGADSAVISMNKDTLKAKWEEEWADRDLDYEVTDLMIVSDGPSADTHYLAGMAVSSSNPTRIEYLPLDYDSDADAYQVEGAGDDADPDPHYNCVDDGCWEENSDSFSNDPSCELVNGDFCECDQGSSQSDGGCSLKLGPIGTGGDDDNDGNPLNNHEVVVYCYEENQNT